MWLIIGHLGAEVSLCVVRESALRPMKCYIVAQIGILMKYLTFLLVLLSSTTWAKPLIVTSIHPLTMIVTAIAGDAAEVRQLLPNTAEPHHYALRISDRALLNQANLIVWTGPELETFLTRTIASQDPEKVITATALADIEGAKLTESNDPHIWLNPHNGIVIATETSNWIAAHHPALRENILARQQQFRAAVLTVSDRISKQLHPHGKAKILVDHDGFGHFFSAFNIRQAGALKSPSGLGLSAGKLHNLLAEGEFDCIATEPRSAHNRVNNIASAVDTPTVSIDSHGADIPASATAYTELLEEIATALASCLSPQR